MIKIIFSIGTLIWATNMVAYATASENQEAENRILQEIAQQVTAEPVVTQKAAAPTASAPTVAERSEGMTSTYIRMFGSLLVVLALFAGGVWIFKKAQRQMSGSKRSNKEPLEVISRLPIGPKREVIVIRAVDSLLAIASSESGISYLTTLDDQIDSGDRNTAVMSSATGTRRISAPVDELVDSFDRIETRSGSMSKVKDRLKGLKDLR